MLIPFLDLYQQDSPCKDDFELYVFYVINNDYFFFFKKCRVFSVFAGQTKIGNIFYLHKNEKQEN